MASAGGTENILRLRDGRRLGFEQFGDLRGAPIFFFHGGGDSRLQRHHDDSIAHSLGIRLITVDRPGVGLSDFLPRRRLMHWAEDIGQLADALNLTRFAVLGYSMGGPHALACAAGLPDRVTCCGVVSGIAPFDRPNAMDDVSPFVQRMFVSARRTPLLARVPLYFMARQVRRDATTFVDGLFAEAPEHDRSVYHRAGRRENQIAAVHEASRQGPRGLAWELSMLARPWSLPFDAIRAPVYLWYGTADATTPVQMGTYLASVIPPSQLVLWPDEGHQAIFTHWTEVLTALRSG